MRLFSSALLLLVSSSSCVYGQNAKPSQLEGCWYVDEARFYETNTRKVLHSLAEFQFTVTPNTLNEVEGELSVCLLLADRTRCGRAAGGIGRRAFSSSQASPPIVAHRLVLARARHRNAEQFVCIWRTGIRHSGHVRRRRVHNADALQARGNGRR